MKQFQSITLLSLLLLPAAFAQQGPEVGPPCVERAIEEFDKETCTTGDVACYCEQPNQSKLSSDMSVACVAASDTPAVQSIPTYVASFCHIVEGTGGQETSSGSSPAAVSTTVSSATTLPGVAHPSSGSPTSLVASTTSSVSMSSTTAPPQTTPMPKSTAMVASNATMSTAPSNGNATQSSQAASASSSITPKSGAGKAVPFVGSMMGMLVGIGGAVLFGWSL